MKKKWEKKCKALIGKVLYNKILKKYYFVDEMMIISYLDFPVLMTTQLGTDTKYELPYPLIGCEGSIWSINK